MRTTLKLLAVALVTAVLVTALPLIAQNVVDYPGHLLFRPQNPEIRYVGDLIFKSVAGAVATESFRFSTAGMRAVPLATAATTLPITSAHCGRTIVSTHTTATQTFTLPASAAVPGCKITFVAGDAGTEILINTAGASEIVNIMTFAAVGADADTARVVATGDTTAIKNTAATNVLGDTVQLVADGIVTWYGVGVTAGIWAAQ